MKGNLFRQTRTKAVLDPGSPRLLRRERSTVFLRELVFRLYPPHWLSGRHTIPEAVETLPQAEYFDGLETVS
jgi:hypothetical protein